MFFQALQTYLAASTPYKPSQENVMSNAPNEVENYNRLMQVTHATKYLAEAGGDAVVGPVLEKIAELGLGNEIGLRLLHKHNDLETGEAMVERDFADDEGYALVTSVTSGGLRDYVPNSWQLTENGFIAIEYSHPDLLCSPHFDITANAEKFSKLYELLSELKLDRVLGPSINYNRNVYQDEDPTNTAFLEKTDVENRANVVRRVNRHDPSFTNSAKTKWYARRMMDSDGKVRWLTACNCFCSVFPEGGHQGTTTHQYSGDEDKKEKR
jgi:hypothetical protein